MGAEREGQTAATGDTHVGRRIVVTGGRGFSDAKTVAAAFDALGVSSDDVIVEGEAPGADALCRMEAERRGARVERFPAEWSRYGRMAGPIRNRRMLEGGADLLLAFPGGRGTRGCIAIAKEMGMPVIHSSRLVGNRGNLGA